MSRLNLSIPTNSNMVPNITVLGVGGAGCNAVNDMIQANLTGVRFVVANTDVQSLDASVAERKLQLGIELTKGLGAGSSPEVGKAAAEESIREAADYVEGSNLLFIIAGMGGGTGTGASAVVAKMAQEKGILTIAIVTTPFDFEGSHRAAVAKQGIRELKKFADIFIVVNNQNLFRLVNEKTTLAEAFRIADNFLADRVRGISDLMTKPSLINLDFADIKTVISKKGKAVMGTGEAEGDNRAVRAAEGAISNPLLDKVSVAGAKGILINIAGGDDITLFEVDAAVTRIREEVDKDANIIFGSTFTTDCAGKIRVSVVATGLEVDPEEELESPPSPGMVSSKRRLVASKKSSNETSFESFLESGDDAADESIDSVLSSAKKSFNKIIEEDRGIDRLDIPAFLRRGKKVDQ